MNKAKADVDLKQIVAVRPLSSHYLSSIHLDAPLVYVLQVGFCFGGRHAILLGGGDSVE